jgi:hypothetical protein
MPIVLGMVVIGVFGVAAFRCSRLAAEQVLVLAFPEQSKGRPFASFCAKSWVRVRLLLSTHAAGSERGFVWQKADALELEP